MQLGNRKEISLKNKKSLASGFTLLEMLVVVALIGIVGMLAMPRWLVFLDGNRLDTANGMLYSGIREAQIQAQAQSMVWQFSVRERHDSIEWATHPASVSPVDAHWKESLESHSIYIDGETTFANAGGVYYVRFDEDGNVQYRLGRITLSLKNNPTLKRCVIVSTVIGASRRSKEQATPRDGKMCY